MKHLKITFYATLIVLMGMTAREMQSNSNKKKTVTCVLGEKRQILSNEYIQYILDPSDDNIELGSIEYYDLPTNRRIIDFIETNQWSQGIGSQALQLFIDQSKKEGIATIELHPVSNRLTNWYKKFGFKETSTGDMILTLSSIKQIDPLLLTAISA